MGETRDLHVGIIPDGTRRWATRHLRGPLWDGHEAGEKAEEILFHLADHYPAVRDVTIWAMSVENFQRSGGIRSGCFSCWRRSWRAQRRGSVPKRDFRSWARCGRPCQKTYARRLLSRSSGPNTTRSAD
jgi:undecaprenyl pyrophosphate synthase